MLLNTNIAVALKDSFSKYTVEKTSIFKMKGINKKFTSFKVLIKNKEFIFKIQCPLCGKLHKYRYSTNEVISRKMLIGGCETLNTPLFFIGNEEKVLEMINKYEYVNNQLNSITINKI